MCSPSLPPSGNYLQSIRDSARSLRESAGVLITPDSIKYLLESPAFISSFKRVSSSHGLALPLNFSSSLDELNLISVLSLLNFGSGYRVPLHIETGRGAWDCIRGLIFSMYISSLAGDTQDDLLSARGMQEITDAKIAELMRVNVYIEKPHDSIPGVTVGELGGPLYELVKLIARVLNETGRVLVDAGYPNLGAFVSETLKEGARAAQNQKSDVEVILEQLVRFVPAFRDMAVVNGQVVYCFKKALFLIHAIAIRFGASSTPPFHIPDTSRVPVFSDNVLPSLLIHLGIIDVSNSSLLASTFANAGSLDKVASLLGSVPSPSSLNIDELESPPKEGPILSPDQAYVLRAAAIDACEMIVETAQKMEEPTWLKGIKLPEVDMWLWSIAKDRKDYRELERFVLRDTVFF